MLANRASLVAVAVVMAIVAVAAVVIVSDNASGHPGHQQKKLFDERYYHQVEGGDYDSWMNLSASEGFFVSCTDVNSCGTRWQNAIDASTSEWNSAPITVDIVPQPGYDENRDFNVEVTDLLLGDPFILGFAPSFDENYELCFADCTVHHGWVLIGDLGHTLLGLTTIEAQRATVSHEIGHIFGLRHESVNSDESILYDCGLDDTGPIPDSIMSYNCIDPVDGGGQGIYLVQPWDVCGVNHAYHDPNVRYAGCTNFVPADLDGLVWGDLNCQGGANPVDGLAVLRFDAGQSGATNSCPELGASLNVETALGPPWFWGDIDCSSLVNPIDGLKLLRFDAGLSVSKVDASCPDVGDALVNLGGTATPVPTETAAPTPTAEPTATASPTPTSGPGQPSNDCDDLSSPIPIPDNDTENGAVLGVEFNDNRTINDLQVCVNIDHTWVGDLGIGIGHAESGTIAVLMAGDGSCSGDDVRVLFSDAASSFADDACATSGPAVNGTFKPTQPLSVFDGESVDGTWLVLVLDAAAGDTGQVLGATIFAQLANQPVSASGAEPDSAPLGLAMSRLRATIERSGRSAVR